MTRPTLTPLFASFLLCPALAPLSMAQDEAPEAPAREADPDARDAVREDRSRISVTLNPSVAYAAERDYDTGVGDVETTRLGGEVTLAIPLDSRGRLSVGVGAFTTDYSVSVNPAFAGGTNAATISAQFDDVQELTFNTMYTRSLDDNGTSLFVGGRIGSASEGGVDFDDALVWGAFGGVSWRMNDNLTLGVGVGVFSRLEDDVRIIPLPTFRYVIDDRWTLMTEGPGLKLDYMWNETMNMGVHARFRGDDFRIETDNTLVPGGAVSNSMVPITYYLDTILGDAKNIALYAEVGVVVAGETEIFNAAGNVVVEEDIDPGVFAGLSLKIRF